MHASTVTALVALLEALTILPAAACARSTVLAVQTLAGEQEHRWLHSAAVSARSSLQHPSAGTIPEKRLFLMKQVLLKFCIDLPRILPYATCMLVSLSTNPGQNLTRTLSSCC